MTVGKLWILDFEPSINADHYPKSLAIIPNHEHLWGLGINQFKIQNSKFKIKELLTYTPTPLHPHTPTKAN